VAGLTVVVGALAAATLGIGSTFLFAPEVIPILNILG